MKFGIIAAVIVIALIIFGGWWSINSTDQPTEDEVQELFDASVTQAPENGQLLQMIPSDVPVGEDDSSLPESSPAVAPVGEATISIDETGFSPAAMTIPVGTEVTFVNNGQAPHWPASDVHPTHEILPEFDAKRGLPTGETYSYTFTEAGTWGCHDHLLPSATCTITVTSN